MNQLPASGRSSPSNTARNARGRTSTHSARRLSPLVGIGRATSTASSTGPPGASGFYPSPAPPPSGGRHGCIDLAGMYVPLPSDEAGGAGGADPSGSGQLELSPPCGSYNIPIAPLNMEGAHMAGPTAASSRRNSRTGSPILSPAKRDSLTESRAGSFRPPPVPSGPLAEALLTTERLRDARKAYESNDPRYSANIHQKFADQLANGALINHPEKTLEEGELVRPLVFGGLDGISTSFALLAGAIGVNLSTAHFVALGLAQVFAGAFSMAFGEYVSSKAERQIALRELNREKWEVENFPEGEIAEMIQIYMQHGVNVEDAQKVAFTLSKYPKFWVEHMLLHEIGILPPGESDDAWRSSLAMFFSFCVFGFVPIGTYLMVEVCFGTQFLEQHGFALTCLASLFTLFLLGFAKNKIAESDPWQGGFGMVFQGCIAGAISYMIGVYCGGGEIPG
eukprot:g7883.t1